MFFSGIKKGDKLYPVHDGRFEPNPATPSMTQDCGVTEDGKIKTAPSGGGSTGAYRIYLTETGGTYTAHGKDGNAIHFIDIYNANESGMPVYCVVDGDGNVILPLNNIAYDGIGDSGSALFNTEYISGNGLNAISVALILAEGVEVWEVPYGAVISTSKTIDADSTDTQIPTAKAVHDAIRANSGAFIVEAYTAGYIYNQSPQINHNVTFNKTVAEAVAHLPNVVMRVVNQNVDDEAMWLYPSIPIRNISGEGIALLFTGRSATSRIVSIYMSATAGESYWRTLDLVSKDELAALEARVAALEAQ